MNRHEVRQMFPPFLIRELRDGFRKTELSGDVDKASMCPTWRRLIVMFCDNTLNSMNKATQENRFPGHDRRGKQPCTGILFYG